MRRIDDLFLQYSRDDHINIIIVWGWCSANKKEKKAFLLTIHREEPGSPEKQTSSNFGALL